MKTINDLYEDKTPKVVKFDEKKTLNDFFEEKAKEKENQNPEQKNIAKPQKKIVFVKKKQPQKKGIWYEIESFFYSFTNVEKSITITLFVLFCLVISLLVIQLQNKDKEVMIEMAHLPDLIEELEELRKESEPEPQPEIPNNSKVTISAYNESDMSLQHSESAMKSLDEIFAEREMQEANELMASNALKNDFVLPSETGLEREKSVIKKEETVNKNALVKYSLTNRTLQGELPNPIFTCEKYGTVVIIIKVSEVGNVIEATVDKAKTTTSDGCLLDNALIYAQQAQFNVARGSGVQVGSITYSFQQKR